MISIIESSFDTVWESDINGIITYISDQVYEIYGGDNQEQNGDEGENVNHRQIH